MPSGIASPHTGPVTRVAGQQAVGIATPGARISRLGPSQCAQNTTQVVAAETGRNLFSLVWQANVNSGDPSGRGVSIFDSNVAPMTIPAHVRAIRFDGTRAFDPRNTSILRRGQLVMFTNLPMSTMGFVGILDPQLPPLDRKSVLTHCYGNTKMSAPTSVDMDVLVTSQSEHEVRRVHLPWLRAAQPAPDPMSGVVWCRRTEFRFPATPGGKLYGTEPRGVVQGRWFFDSRSGIGRFRSKVWVACRGGTGPDNLHNPAIQSYDSYFPRVLDSISPGFLPTRSDRPAERRRRHGLHADASRTHTHVPRTPTTPTRRQGEGMARENRVVTCEKCN
jgi:hypothetical protein